MEEILDILKYTIPAFIVFVATYFVMKKFMDVEYRKQMLEIRKDNQKTVIPLRLQSFERLVLFLERISPDNLVLRIHKNGMSAKLLQVELLRAINEEYNHNLTQQIYISTSSWEIVRKAKDEMVRVINLAGTQMSDASMGADLGQKIFEIMIKLEKSPTQMAINVLKNEIRQLF
jgi:hypothetical protein